MQKAATFLYYYLRNRGLQKRGKRLGIHGLDESLGLYGGHPITGVGEFQKMIAEKIRSGQPFFAGRFGFSELFVMRSFEFSIQSHCQKSMEQFCTWSGFFPNEREAGKSFLEIMKQSANEADFLGCSAEPFEEYFIRRYMKDSLQVARLDYLEPWTSDRAPWTAALEGKKVLVIHPFEDSILKQYQKRELLFPGTDILPEFELRTLKAVQTIAGQTDERFSTWFDALRYMFERAMEIPFDIAIIGCGAYGFPLAAKIKEAGRQAFHLGGATQILFGIKGSRWTELEDFAYVRKYFNEHWEFPLESERPREAGKVEGACYW